MNTLPVSVDSEYYVLAEMLATGEIEQTINSDCFYVKLNKELFNLFKEKKNTQTILEECPYVESHIRDIIRHKMPITKRQFHIDRLTEMARLRKIIEYSEFLTQQAYNREQIDINEVIKNISALDTIQGNEPVTFHDCCKEYLDTFADRVDFIKTHFASLDDLLIMEKGDLVIIAARPACGKTAFQLQVAINMAFAGRKVLAFSLEMRGKQLAMRGMANITGITLDNIRRKNLPEPDKEKIEKWVHGKIKEMKLKIMDNVFSYEQIRKHIRKEKNENGLDVVMVDYLQLAKTLSPSKNKNEAVGEVTRDLKQLAKEENILIIILSQLSRGLEARADKRPMMSDLRDSGEIEQDADTIIMLYNDEVYNADTEQKNIMEVIIRKQRQAGTGTVPLYFEKETQRIRAVGYDT